MNPGLSTRGRDAAVAPQYLIDASSPKEITMRDIANATLSGNLTREVELRALPSGADAARLRIATTTRRRNGEDWVDKTNYFTVEVYGGRARACAEYLRKGSRVFVDAELDWREWTDQHDNKREAVTFRARQVLFEGGRAKPADVDSSEEQDGGSAMEGQPVAPVGASLPEGGEGSVGPDDLPF
jgi:single-strand DNA-binding protein